MKKIFIILLSVFCLLGCGPGLYQYHGAKNPHPVAHVVAIPVWVDSNFNQENQEAILAAINEWNFVLNGQAHLIYSGTFKGKEEGLPLYRYSQKTGLGLIVVNLDSEDDELDGVPASVLAFVPGTMSHAMVVIRDHIGTRVLKDIILHEFGHILGADHVYAPSLMFPGYTNKQYPCIDKITALQVATYLDLDPDTLRYCRTPLIP